MLWILEYCHDTWVVGSHLESRFRP